jgi:hydrogenase large subunit
MMVRKFIDAGSLAPFVPRYEGDYRLPKKVNVEATRHYVEALNMRRHAQEMLAIWGGHMPHNMSMVPGGTTQQVTVDKIADFRWRLEKLRHFIDNVYIPDVIAVAEVYSDYFGIGAGCGNYLAYGVFDLDQLSDLTKRARLFPQGRTSVSDLSAKPVDPSKISEHVKHSWYSSPSQLYPGGGETIPDRKKSGAYSWLKSPRYDGEVYEVGPLARQVNAYVRGVEPTKTLVNNTLGHFKAGPGALASVLGRHAARAIEAKIVADNMADWVLSLKPGEPVHVPYKIPYESEGMGLTDAPRGALGHWIKIKNHKIDTYQCVVPTTWNGSPRDDNGRPGPFEQALEGTPVRDTENPYELVRIVRSFDPCLACAIHVVNAKRSKVRQFVIG